MPADNSCGDAPMWQYTSTEHPVSQIDPDKEEIKKLQSEILSLKVRIQSDELEKLMEKVVRDENPTIKDAWEQYQAVLKLTTK